MQPHYESDLVEAAVFRWTKRRDTVVAPLQLARFHRERDRLYRILDPDERDAAFARLHLEWFREWGLDRQLTIVLAEFPVLSNHLDRLAVRQARSPAEEGAELYVNDQGQRTGVLALRPSRFEPDPGSLPFLRHELSHLSDMVDPGFGYSPDLELAERDPARQRLARERYRLVWDITIDGRITAAGHPPPTPIEAHAAAFAGAYPFWSADRRAEAFARLWNHPAPRHDHLQALISDPRGLRSTRGPAPGGSCGLCGFPTFDWADATLLPEAILTRIRTEFPTWAIEEALCRRCLETYEAAAISP